MSYLVQFINDPCKVKPHRQIKVFQWLMVLVVFISGCATSSRNYNPARKFPKSELQQDFALLRKILEEKHPALYWYTPKDSMDYYFDSLYNQVSDSMTELQFGWKIIAPITQKVRCGHTSFSMSKQWGRFQRDRRRPSFPLFMKIWADTMVVTGNLNRADSTIQPGMLVTSINGIRNTKIIERLFNYLPLDGYANNVNYVRISGNFPYYHRNIFGISRAYRVGYIDSTGVEKTASVPVFVPPSDSTKKKERKREERLSRKERRQEMREDARSLEIASDRSMATVSLNTFSKGDGRKLRLFLSRSFKKLKQDSIQNLVLDLRSNGGGDVGMYVLLTKYIRKSRFKVADSSYAVAKSLRPYTSHIRRGFFHNLGLLFMTRKRADGFYHFGYWERHYFKPRKRNHFDGKVYVLTNGPTFSASTLFCNAVKGQDNVLLVGEETGGGWHGNSGLLIPDITLPITKLRVRLPLFKLVQYKHVPKDGRGITPDVYVGPTTKAVRDRVDSKMEYIKALIDAQL